METYSWVFTVASFVFTKNCKQSKWLYLAKKVTDDQYTHYITWISNAFCNERTKLERGHVIWLPLYTFLKRKTTKREADQGWRLEERLTAKDWEFCSMMELPGLLPDCMKYFWKLEEMYTEEGWILQSGAAAVEGCMELPQQIKKGTALWPSDSSSGNLS